MRVYTSNMENDLTAKLAELEGKIDATYEMSRKTYRIMYWTGIVTLVLVGLSVVSLMLLPLFLPSFFAAEGVNSLQGL